ncbi:MAG: peptidoglycan DD-metalloendopeptidase family protein [Candidatus Harrisonbacteria bacterium]|nr:peptidoglycan DD-metalloendopeptidase family protein [Candidatus Harrisonbacteria bacterium]
MLGALIIFLISSSEAASNPSFGGPELGSAEDPALSLGAVVASDIPASIEIASDPEQTAGFIILESASVLGTDNPFIEGEIPNRDEVITYTIKEGDNLSILAEKFGISLNTLLWANSGVSANKIRPGQEIVILPVSGVRHIVKSGDTLSSIASKYQVTTAQIKEFNEIEDNVIVLNQELVIPGGKPLSSPRAIASRSVANNTPSYAGYYARPASGYNWGLLHGNNGIDIANACGSTGIYAAAAGTIIKTAYGWNGGYGNMIMIAHANGTETLYAHLQSISVSGGSYVNQGDYIGAMGNTGKVYGATGCHLHFEVRGARNPFSK